MFEPSSSTSSDPRRSASVLPQRSGSACRAGPAMNKLLTADGALARRVREGLATAQLHQHVHQGNSSGHAGSQAPHSVQPATDAARSSRFAPCWMARARPLGVRRTSRDSRHTGQTSRQRPQPVQSWWRHGAQNITSRLRIMAGSAARFIARCRSTTVAEHSADVALHHAAEAVVARAERNADIVDLVLERLQQVATVQRIANIGSNSQP